MRDRPGASEEEIHVTMMDKPVLRSDRQGTGWLACSSVLLVAGGVFKILDAILVISGLATYGGTQADEGDVRG